MYVLELAGEDDDFAVREASSACAEVTQFAPGLATARSLDRQRVAGLAYTHAVSDLVGRCDPSIAAARSVLEAAPLDQTGTVAVRARDVRGRTGVSTANAERVLGEVLVERGFAVDLDDPLHELRVLFAKGVCALGWLAVESQRDFGARRPTDRPFFQPGSMDPLVARALANIAGARPGKTLLDPMCGTGGVLIEAGLVGATVLGVDAQTKMVRGARDNLDHYLTRSVGPGGVATGSAELLRGDATSLPLHTDTVDTVVFDAPYGRQSKIAGQSLDRLVSQALREARRVAGRGIVVGDRPWTEAAQSAGWTVESAFRRDVHRSLTRHVLVLE